MRWIVDITRAAFASEPATLERVLTSVARDDQIHVIHREEQKHVLEDSRLTWWLVPHDVVREEEAFLNWAQEQVNGASRPGEALTVTSYWAPFESLAERLDGGRTVEYRKLGAVGSKSEAVKAWQNSFMSKQEAADFVVRVVGAGSGKVHITELRAKLALLDARFQKDTGGYAARTGFISTIIGVAAELGYVQPRNKSGQPAHDLIVLTNSGRSRYQSLADKLRGPQPAQAIIPPQPIMTVPDLPASEKLKGRSQEFITALRDQRMGPFQQVRLEIIRQIGKVAREGQHNPIGVVETAIKSVRNAESTAGLKDFDNLPWPRIRTFMRKLLSLAPVLLANDEPVTGGWGEAGDRIVNDVAPKFDLTLDGLLIVALVKQGLDVTQDDEPDLAGALYNSRDDEFMSLLDHVISHLTASKVVRWDSGTNLLVLL